MPLSPLSLMLLFASLTILVMIVFVVEMLGRIRRIRHAEQHRTSQTIALDSTQLMFHLQTLNIPGIEMDSEVAILKDEVMQAARKHHLIVDS